MKLRLLVVAAAVGCALLFALAYTGDWLRGIFRCEGFGCIGLGILYLALAVLVVLAFAVAGAYLGTRPRWVGAMLAGSVAAVAMLAAFWYIRSQNEARIAEAEAMHESTCARYPKLCPERSAPPGPAQP